MFDFNQFDEYSVVGRYGFALITSTNTGRAALAAPITRGNVVAFVIIDEFDDREGALLMAIGLTDTGITPEHYTGTPPESLPS